MAKYDQTDDSVVVIVGAGAGGGTLANELTQKGVRVVLLEAGKRQSSATFVNDEWPSFHQPRLADYARGSRTVLQTRRAEDGRHADQQRQYGAAGQQ